MLQSTLAFDGVSDLVPVADHPDDIVLTECGTYARRGDCFEFDGAWFLDEAERDEARDEAHAETLAAFLEACDQWADDYTSSDDYGADYAYLMTESDGAFDSLARWVHDKLPCSVPDAIIRDASNALADLADPVCVSECSSQSGDCCLYSVPVGEHEEQVEWSRFEEWCESENRPVPPMEYVNAHHSHAHLKADDRFPCFCVYSNPGNRWDYTVTADQICEAMRNATRAAFDRSRLPDLAQCGKRRAAIIVRMIRADSAWNRNTGVWRHGPRESVADCQRAAIVAKLGAQPNVATVAALRADMLADTDAIDAPTAAEIFGALAALEVE